MDVSVPSHQTAHASRRTLVDDAERAVRRWLTPVRFRRGDRLPPEHELAEMLGVSRGTLRSALRRLEQGGVIVRRQGSGTFVAELGPPAGGVRRLTVAASSVRARGSELSAVDVRVERRPSGSPAAEILGIAPRRPAVRVSRTLVSAGGPAAVASDVVHPDIRLPSAAVMRRALHRGESVLDVLGSHAAAPAELRTRLTPCLVSPEEETGRRLGLSSPTACLCLEEVALDALGVAVLFAHDVFTPGAVEIEMLQAIGSAPSPVARAGD